MARVLAASAAAALAAAGGSPEAWPMRFTTWPAATPNQGWPDGPFLGNGNIGLSIGGGDGFLTVYATVHGFWSTGQGHNASFPPLGTPSRPHSDVSPLGFPGCPADNCTLTVGLCIGAISLSSPQLAKGSWSGTQWISNASAAITLTGPGGAALTVTAFVAAEDQLAFLTVENTGTGALDALNVTTYADNNVRHVPIAAGCTDATGTPTPCGAGGAPAPPGHWINKDANSGPAVLPITGVLATRVLPATPGGALPVATSTEPFTAPAYFNDWATGKVVQTAHIGTTTLLPLAPGEAFVLAAAVCASQDPLVVPRAPMDAATEWLGAVDPATGLATRWAAHTAWWDAFWTASAIDLDPAEADTEAFWWTGVYALGAGSREGQVSVQPRAGRA